MAWLTKQSGTMQIERRDTPYLTDELKAQLEKDVLPRYPTKQAATLPALHAVQEKYGFVPYQAMEEIAELLGLSASEVLDTATFYEMYWLEPKGKYVIEVCQSLSCELMGHGDILARIGEKLGIEPGQTTEDGKFSCETVECLGSCGTAPCALVNETLHEDLTDATLEEIIEALE